MNLEEIIKKLSNTELSEYQIQELDKQINQYMNDNNTASNPIVEVCPKCGKVHHKVIKAGKTRGGKQMLRCKDCNKRFVEDTGQLTFYSHQELSKWRIVLKDTLSRVGLRKTAAKIGAHYVTIFRMRHKFLNFLEMITGNDTVDDVTEIDEKYIAASHKGTKIEDVEPRKHGSKASKAGLSKQQVCIMTALSRGNNVYIHTYNTGRPTDVDAHQLCEHIEEKTYCFLDGIKIYDWSLKKLNCDFKHLKRSDYTKTEHLNTVNQLHSVIEQDIIWYKNIATKYINRYNALFMIKYNMRDLTMGEKIVKLLGLLRQHQKYFFIRQISSESIFSYSSDIFR